MKEASSPVCEEIYCDLGPEGAGCGGRTPSVFIFSLVHWYLVVEETLVTVAEVREACFPVT